MAERRATYRVQLTPSFGFVAAAEAVPYLARLGVSHCYVSPLLQAAPGSTHGYDVVDHGTVNAEIGGTEAHQRLIEMLATHGMGQLLDVVPNHMSVTAGNRWWWDVLEHGPSSPYAGYFDVDWYPPEERFRNVILLPVLGDHYGRELERGAITLHRAGASFTIRYGEQLFPVNPRALHPLVRQAALDADSEQLAFIADVLEALPTAAPDDTAAAEKRHRDARGALDLLGRVVAESGPLARALDDVVAATNGDGDRLDRLLDGQHYRLAFWQAAGRDLAYRRFFDVNSLIALCVENERVFRDTHRLIFAWLRAGVVDGLRIDHPDGLRDPEQYLRRLAGAFPGLYVAVEKILQPGERLPEHWPVAGTTGYEFLNAALGLFVDPAAEAAFDATYRAFTGVTATFAELSREKKLLVLRESLGSDVNRLADQLLQVCERHRRHRDYTRHQVTEAVRELVAAFPVYRSYVRPAANEVRDADRAAIAAAVARAKEARPDLDPALLEFVESLLTLAVVGPVEAEFVQRFQQLTGPAAAKGVEDTALYCYNRFVALNEVGGDPGRFGLDIAAFHDFIREAAARHPATMLATATHDTKRGEDVRARLAALSEFPDEWREAVTRWSAMLAPHRTGDLPDHNAEYLFYQTLVGAWPIDAARLAAFMEKAVREAKQHTSWTAPDADYEGAWQRFIDGALSDPTFVADAGRFVHRLLAPGRVVSLAQTLIKLTAPGVPDFYQGTELWSHTLVDPDNRQPVDFALRQRLLDELCALSVDEVMARAEEGLPKMWLIRQALALRAERPRDFARDAAYEPLAATGRWQDRVVAFSRNASVVTIVPRLAARITDWDDTALRLPEPEGAWHSVLTGEPLPAILPISAAFARFPVALLAR